MRIKKLENKSATWTIDFSLRSPTIILGLIACLFAWAFETLVPIFIFFLALAIAVLLLKDPLLRNRYLWTVGSKEK